MSRKKGIATDTSPQPMPTMLLSEHEKLSEIARKQIEELTSKLKAVESENHNLHAKLSVVMAEASNRESTARVVEESLYPGTTSENASKPNLDTPVMEAKPKLVKVRIKMELSYTDWQGHPRTARPGDVVEYEEAVYKMMPRRVMEKVIEI